MNKRYMDFVPAKGKINGPKPVEKRVVEPRPVRKVTKTVSKPVFPARETKNVVPAMVKKPVMSKNTVEYDYRLGVVEEVGQMEKNPVSGGLKTNDELRELKAKKVGMKEEKKVAPAEKTSGLKTKTSETFKTPRTQFINQDKVVKRPLSKNVYRKEVKVSEEEKKGPVTIITKPEKSAKISLVITIIITIILGAAAGTVAFLILPK